MEMMIKRLCCTTKKCKILKICYFFKKNILLVSIMIQIAEGLSFVFCIFAYVKYDTCFYLFIYLFFLLYLFVFVILILFLIFLFICLLIYLSIYLFIYLFIYFCSIYFAFIVIFVIVIVVDL